MLAGCASAHGHPSVVGQALEAHALHGQEPRSVAVVEHGAHQRADQLASFAHEPEVVAAGIGDSRADLAALG